MARVKTENAKQLDVEAQNRAFSPGRRINDRARKPALTIFAFFVADFFLTAFLAVFSPSFLLLVALRQLVPSVADPALRSNWTQNVMCALLATFTDMDGPLR